jgi:hypothetical protein
MSHKKNWFKEIRTLSTMTLVNKLLSEDLLIESLMLSQEIEDARVDYSHRAADLMQKIRETNNQILQAETKDEAATAEARVRLFEKEYQRIINLAKKAAVKCLLSGRYFAVAHFGDDTVIVPSRSWVGKFDWEEERLVFEQREYSSIRIIAHEQLSSELQKRVHQLAEEDVDVQCNKDRGPGRPSDMDIVKEKLRHRAQSGEWAKALNAESKYLSEWFNLNHPDRKKLTPKSIANALRSFFNELKLKPSQENPIL